MKALILIIAGSLAASTVALAQESTVRGNASTESQTAISASRRGASVESDTRAQGGVTAERGANGGAAADLAGASELNATLERSVDARRAKPGDEVMAKTNEDLTTRSGITIPRGTKLVGHVTEARRHARGEGSAEGRAASQLGIVFDKAVLGDGREVPMNATIQAVAAARSEAEERGGSAAQATGAFGGASRAAGTRFGRIGGRPGGVGAGGALAGSAGATLGGVTRLPGAGTGAAATGAAGAAAHGGAVLGSSAGAVGGLSSSGRWVTGSRGVFGLRDLDIVSTVAGSAQGSLITSRSRNVRLDGGTQLLLVGTAGAASR